MAILVAHSKNGKVRLYTTYSDKYITGWIEKEDALKILIDDIKEKHRDEIKRLKKNFPKGFTDPRNYKKINLQNNLE
jgi:hypothetical protein